MNEWDRIVIQKAIAEAMIEAMGMTAENEQRKACGHSMAYDEKAFANVIDRMNAVFDQHRA